MEKAKVLELDQMDQFDHALILIKQMHDRKKADYSSVADRFSNFKIAGQFANVTTAEAIEVLIGVKQARLLELTRSNRPPANESILDTYLDRAVYAVLAYCYYLHQSQGKSKP